MSVNNISAYSNISETIRDFGSAGSVSEMYDAIKNKKKDLKALFEGGFATMGQNSEQAQTIAQEIEELSALIKVEQAKIEKWNKQILDSTAKIGDAKDDLDNLIAETITKNDELQQQTKDAIVVATNDVINLFALGQLDEDDVPSEIQKRVGDMTTTYNFDESKISSLSNVIADQTKVVTGLITQRNLAGTKVSTSNAALQLLTEMYNVQIMALGTQVTEKAGKKPVYTPEKQAYVDQLYAQYHATATAGVDQFSIANEQVRNIGAALNIGSSTATTDTGAYTLSQKIDTADTPAAQRTNLYGGSILQEMFNKGFSYKEAMYACQYIFGTSTSLLSYNSETDVLTRGWGHTATAGVSHANSDARVILNSFENQARSLWGKDVATVDPTTGVPTTSVPTVNPTTSVPTVNPTTSVPTVNPTTSVPTVNPTVTVPTVTVPTLTTETSQSISYTDPIGWSQGNVTFEFVVDRNKDGKFNGRNEFLGANNGISELTALDKDGNGLIEGEELDNLMLLRTDHSVQGFGFMTAADAGIEKIDLSTLFDENGALKDNVSSPHANVNGNVLKNTFGITLKNGSSVTGYQTLDDNNYLDAVYAARYGKDMISKIDFTKAENREALNEIGSFRTFESDAEIAEMETKRAAIFSRFTAKRSEVQRAVTVQQRELVQDLKAAQRTAERDVDVIQEQWSKEEDEREYGKRGLEDRLTALRNKKSTIETELKNLYNKDETEYLARKSKLEADLEATDTQILNMESRLQVYNDINGAA